MNNQNNSFMDDQDSGNQGGAPIPPSWATGSENTTETPMVDNLQPQGGLEMPVDAQNNPVNSDPQQNGQVPLDQMGFYQSPPTAGGQDSSKTWIIITVVVILLAAGGVGFAYSKGLIGSAKKTVTKPADNIVTPPVIEEKPIILAPNPIATAAGRDNIRKTDIQNIKTQLKAYYQQNQLYPKAASQKISDTNSVLNVLVPTYLKTLPVDPLSPTYYYNYKSDGVTFEISSVLEVKSDNSAKKMGNTFLYIVTDSSYEIPVSPISSTSSSGSSLSPSTNTPSSLTTPSTTKPATIPSTTTTPTSATSSSLNSSVTTPSTSTSSGTVKSTSQPISTTSLPTTSR